MVSNNRMNNNIKWIAITCITCFSIGFAMLFARIGDYTNFFSKSWDINNKVIDEKSAGVSDEVGEININTSSMGISILKSESKEIKAVLSGYSGGAAVWGDYNLHIDRTNNSNGDRIDIKVEGNRFIFFGFSDYKLNIYIPADYNKNIAVTSSSGSIDINNFSFSKMALHNTSGSIKGESLKADEMDIKSVSGSIRLNDAAAETLTAGTTSGSLRLDGIVVNEKIDATSVSGSVRVNFKEFDGKAYMKTISGSCRTDFPDDASLSIKASSSSGSVSCGLNFTGNKKDHFIDGSVNNGINPVEINTTSGSIKID